MGLPVIEQSGVGRTWMHMAAPANDNTRNSPGMTCHSARSSQAVEEQLYFERAVARELAGDDF